MHISSIANCISDRNCISVSISARKILLYYRIPRVRSRVRAHARTLLRFAPPRVSVRSFREGSRALEYTRRGGFLVYHRTDDYAMPTGRRGRQRPSLTAISLAEGGARTPDWVPERARVRNAFMKRTGAFRSRGSLQRMRRILLVCPTAPMRPRGSFHAYTTQFPACHPPVPIGPQRFLFCFCDKKVF